MEQLAPFYAQVLGLGLIWVTFHCIGMCGPIMASLTLGMGVRNAESTPARIWRATKGVLAYQGGRSLVYIALGATAGLVGAAAQQLVASVARSTGLVVAVALIGVGLWKLLPVDAAFSSADSPSSAQSWTATVMRKVGRWLPKTGAMRMAGFGLVFGFLPCMLMFSILAIAASTASAFHGAMVMLLLVAMTTPVLIFAACGASLPGFSQRLRSDWVMGAGLLLSGTWLGLIAAGANGWIDHVSFSIELADRTLPVMLW